MGRTEEKMIEMEKLLVEYPFSREKASFAIIKGIYCIVVENETEATRYFNEGFELFREAKYIPGTLMSLNTILFFLKEFRINSRLLAHYQKVWKRYADEYKFAELQCRIGKQLNFHLG